MCISSTVATVHSTKNQQKSKVCNSHLIVWMGITICFDRHLQAPSLLMNGSRLMFSKHVETIEKRIINFFELLLEINVISNYMTYTT